MAAGCFALIAENSLNNSWGGGGLWVRVLAERWQRSGGGCGVLLRAGRLVSRNACLWIKRVPSQQVAQASDLTRQKFAACL